MRASSQLRRRLWPFGLLVLAWFCANVPHSAVANLFSWVKDGEHFSHQARLRIDAIAALTAGKSPGSKAYVSSQQPVKRAPLTIPSEGMTKKTEPLFAHDTRVLGNVKSERIDYRDELLGPPEILKGDTPHPPPRFGV